MMSLFLFSLVFVLSASTLLANGGPWQTSPVFGSGEAGPANFIQRDVEIVSEFLEFTPLINFVEVNAIYTLYNYGEDLLTGYCFPVTSVILPEENWYSGEFDPNHDIQNFRIFHDGIELPITFLEAVQSTSTVNEYGYTVQAGNHMYTTELEIPAGDTTEVEVSYFLRATYEDFETTKDFFPSYEDRRFRYDMRPAAFWGNGTIGKFSMIINSAELHASNGSMQTLPEGGVWLDADHYSITEEYLNLNSFPQINFAFESRSALSAQFLERNRVSPDCYTVTASSELQGDYGPGNLSDSNLSTTWAEGVEGTTGEWILLNFEADTHVAWVGLVPGYAKSEYTYTANARPLEALVEVSIEGTHVSSYKIEIPEVPLETILEGSIYEVLREVYNRGESFPLSSIRITFEGTAPGSEYDDLCISELVVASFLLTE